MQIFAFADYQSFKWTQALRKFEVNLSYLNLSNYNLSYNVVNNTALKSIYAFSKAV